MNSSKKTGLMGEILAARYLREKGYTIAAANFRSGSGEIDIIAELEGVYVFVEVKARSAGGLFAPAEAVDYAKESRVKSTAAAYIGAKKIKADIRFDIVEVIFDGDKHTINHIENAF